MDPVWWIDERPDLKDGNQEIGGEEGKETSPDKTKTTRIKMKYKKKRWDVWDIWADKDTSRSMIWRAQESDLSKYTRHFAQFL